MLLVLFSFSAFYFIFNVPKDWLTSLREYTWLMDCLKLNLEYISVK